MTRRNTSLLTWSPEALQAFQELKNRFTSAPILHHPDPIKRSCDQENDHTSMEENLLVAPIQWNILTKIDLSNTQDPPPLNVLHNSNLFQNSTETNFCVKFMTIPVLGILVSPLPFASSEIGFIGLLCQMTQ